MSGLDMSEHGTPIGDDGARALATAAFAGRLRDLRLGRSGIGPAGLAALAPALHTRVLDLRCNPLEDDDLSAVCAIAELEVLDVGSCEVDARALRILAASPPPGLHTVALHHAMFTEGWDEGWDRTPLRLRSLGLGMASMAGDLGPLLRSPACAQLEALYTLDVDGDGLAGAPCLPRLRALQVPWASLDAAQLRAVLPDLGALEQLDLTGNDVGDAGLQALLDAGVLRAARRIGLERTGLSAAAAAALLAADLPDDVRLELGDNELGKAACEALRARFPDARADWLADPRRRRTTPRVLERT